MRFVAKRRILLQKCQKKRIGRCVGALKMRDWKMRDWKYRHQTAGGGKCRTGKFGNGKGMERHVWHNIVAHMNTEKCRPSLSHFYHHGAASVLDQILYSIQYLIRLSCHVQSQLLWQTYLQHDHAPCSGQASVPVSRTAALPATPIPCSFID